MAKILNIDNINCWQRYETIASRNAKWYSHFERQFGSFIKS